MAQVNGVVRWFNNADVYTFLGCSDGPDVFVHYSSISYNGYKNVEEAKQVAYDVLQGEQDPQADQVRQVLT